MQCSFGDGPQFWGVRHSGYGWSQAYRIRIAQLNITNVHFIVLLTVFLVR